MRSNEKNKKTRDSNYNCYGPPVKRVGPLLFSRSSQKVVDDIIFILCERKRAMAQLILLLKDHSYLCTGLSSLRIKKARHLGNNSGDVDNGGADELRPCTVHLASITSRHDRVGGNVSCRVHPPNHQEFRAAVKYVRPEDHLLDSFPGYNENNVRTRGGVDL